MFSYASYAYVLWDRILHLPVTLRTRQHCFLTHSVLSQGVSYASYAYVLRDRILHLPVTLHTRRYCFLVYLVLGEVVS